MQLILSPQQMKALEERAFELGLSSLLVMEQAARGAHAALSRILGGVAGKDILYLIGSGNNGGDGLAMARLCWQDGGRPRLLLLREPHTKDALINLAQVKALGIPVLRFDNTQDASAFRKPQAVVDALFGTGFHGSLPEELVPLAAAVAAWQVPVFAVDVPSGLDGDSGAVLGAAFQASHTLAIGHLKTGLCLSQRPELVGQVEVIPLHLPHQAYPHACTSPYITALEAQDLLLRLPRRAKNAHKGSCGRVLMYMGSLGMAGAAAMAAQAAEACLRGGAGLVSVACPPDILPILQTLVPNAMCMPIKEALQNPPPHDVLALGCGQGQSEEVWQNILSLFHADKPSVWDADALNLLAKHPMQLGDRAVLTPHPGEAARLLDWPLKDVLEKPLEAASQLQTRYGGTVVLKGAVSIIKNAAQTAFNLVGTPALAKGGSGDALAGLLAALLAEDPAGNPFEAASTACLWHGMAGIKASERQAERSVLTGEVIACLGELAKQSATLGKPHSDL